MSTETTTSGGKSYLIGYTTDNWKIEGKGALTKPSIRIFHSGWPEGHVAYRMQFFPSFATPPDPHPVETSSLASQIGLSADVFAYLSKIGQADFDWQREQPTRHPPLVGVEIKRIDLKEQIAEGRTGDVYKADASSFTETFPVIAKLVSYRHLPSVVTEALMYEQVLPCVPPTLGLNVPRYLGNYACNHGGWYAILLEDVGKSVGETQNWDCVNDGGTIKRRANIIDRKLKKLGLYHRDVYPRNVVQKEDGKLYFIDFGSAILVDEKKENGKDKEVSNTTVK